MRIEQVDYSAAQTGHADFAIRRIIQDDDLPAAAKLIQQIGYLAWEDSGFVYSLAKEHGRSTAEIAALALDPDSLSKVKIQSRKLAQACKSGGRTAYWLGSVSEPGNVQGFVKVERSDAKLNWAMRVASQMSKRAISLCLHDVNVLPSFQHRSLATAMAYVALSDQPADLPSTLDVVSGNFPMMNWASHYGYQESGTYEESDLFGGLKVEMITYRAASVAAVLGAMEQIRPWLAEGQTRYQVTELNEELDIALYSQATEF